MQVILTLSRPEKWMLVTATYIKQKILNFFKCVEVRILCKKVKYVWGSHFPDAITANMQLGNDSFVFENPVTCKQKISKFTLIFFCKYMSRCPTFIFQHSLMSKWLAKHISTKVSFKITIRKRRVYIDIRWPWKKNQYFYLGIWNDERTKIIFLPSFQLVTRLNSQNRNETIV